MKSHKEQTKADELIDVLARGGIYTTTELAKELDVDEKVVRLLVRKIRKQVLNGEQQSWIYTTGMGYSMDEEKEHVVYESSLRMKMGFGVLVGGLPVFQKCKKIAGVQFNNLHVSFKPKLLKINSLIR